MNNREKAARISSRGNLLFAVCILAAIASASYAVSKRDTLTLALGLSLCAVFLIGACVLVFLHSRAASRYIALAKEEEAEAAARAEAEAAAIGEDGFPYAFVKEIRGYSPAQLRLILDEQAEEYTEEEYAFIRKVLSERE